MKRTKTKHLYCRPAAHRFAPTDTVSKETIPLEADELQAMFLADFESLYHEEGAEKLGVSRPTFAKLLKRGRKKVVEMILLGKELEVMSGSGEFVLAFATDDRITIHPYFLVARYFAFATVLEGKITKIRYVDNPIYSQLQEAGKTIVDDDSAKGMAAGRLIPPLLKGAQLLLVRSLGDGMRRNVEGMGIGVVRTGLSDIDAALNELADSYA